MALRAGRDVLFRVDPGPVRRWRLAVLDRYDGETWRLSGRIVPAGLGVPPHRGPVPADALTQRIELSGLRGPYLPAADRPIRVTAPVDAVEPDAGVLLTSRQLTAGLRYEVISQLRPTAVPTATEPAGAGDLAIPDDLCRPVHDFLTRTPIRPGMHTAEQAEIVQQFLRTHRRNVAGAPSSASAAGIRALLQDGGSGVTVQFASAFALAMRMQGTPARLVVGFEAPGTTIHARDIRVWTEIRYATTGWVRYDPTPPLTRAGTSPQRDDPRRNRSRRRRCPPRRRNRSRPTPGPSRRCARWCSPCSPPPPWWQ